MMRQIIVLISALALSSCGALAPVAPVFAHDVPAAGDWIGKGSYRGVGPNANEWCCGEGDCFVIESDDVIARADGYHVTLRLVDGTAYAVEIVPYAEAQPSPDGAYWRCRKSDGSRRCFFAPPPNA